MADPVDSAAWDAARRDAAWFSLPDAPALVLSGADVRRFCNGMFTNNVRDLPVGGGQRSAMCDAKGKLLGLLDLYLVADDRVLVVLEGSTAEDFEERYGKYIVFDDVELTRAEGSLLTIQGPCSESVLASLGLPIPALGHAAVGQVAVMRRDRTGLGGFDVLTTDAGLGERLGAAAIAEGTFDTLEVLRVEAGKVRWPVDMPGRFLIHELGLRDEVCHFEKGCYVGQEIIHRLDVMGQVRRAITGIRLDSMPSGGECELKIGDDAIGRLTSPVRSPELGAIGLAVVRKPHDAPGTEVELVSGERRIRARTCALPMRGG